MLVVMNHTKINWFIIKARDKSSLFSFYNLYVVISLKTLTAENVINVIQRDTVIKMKEKQTW